MLISTNYHHFESKYIVSDPTRALHSRLVFPHNIETIGLAYQYNFKDYSVQVSSQFLLHQHKNIGEDFDWKNQELTVYSNSQDTLDRYKHYELSIFKNIFSSFSITGNFIYQDIQEHWSNTKQVNYIADNTTLTTGKTLEFTQTFYQSSLGMAYSKEFLKNFIINLNPSFVYSYIYTQDTHILRNFYTQQSCHTFGYNFKVSLKKELTDSTTFGVKFQYIKVEDKRTDMRYYTSSSKELFAIYPSSYQYNNFNFGIDYKYKF